jgi:hypothetical protein
LGENGTLRAAAIIGLVTLTGCVQTVVNAPSANALPECSDLAAELSRRQFEYNAQVATTRAERAATAKSNVCPETRFIRQRIAELSAIVAVSDKMNAKGCYQHPIGEYNRNLLDRLNGSLARCEAQAAATLGDQR